MTTECTQFDITVRKQRDFVMHVYLRDVNNDAIPLTGWSGIAEVRETSSPDSKLIFAFTVSAADIAAGKITVFGSKVITQICQDTGYWDLVLTNPDGMSDTYIMGNVTFVTMPTVLAIGEEEQETFMVGGAVFLVEPSVW